MSDRNRVIINKIVKYCDDISDIIGNSGYEEYKADIKMEYACGMCIIQIGELVTRLSEDFIKENEIVPWRIIRGMRNVYAHDYESIDNTSVWKTLTKDIPKLREQLRNILSDMQE